MASSCMLRACFMRRSDTVLSTMETLSWQRKLFLDRLLDAHIQGVSLPRAVASLPIVLQDADLPPPNDPDSDDDASSFKEADAESDHDVEAYITGTSYEAAPPKV